MPYPDFLWYKRLGHDHCALDHENCIILCYFVNELELKTAQRKIPLRACKKLIKNHNMFKRPSGDIPHRCFHREQGKGLVPGPLIHSLLFQPLPSYEVYAQPPRAPPIVPGEEPESEWCQWKWRCRFGAEVNSHLLVSPGACRCDMYQGCSGKIRYSLNIYLDELLTVLSKAM